MQIIAHDPISTPLLTNSKPYHDENSPFVSWSPPNLAPFLLFRSHFQLNRPYYLAEFELYNLVFAIAVCVIVG
jgi:hypothetical protein